MELLESVDRDEARVFTLAGEIDLASAIMVADLPVPEGLATVVLDLERVRFIDSAGFAAIFGLARKVGGTLVLRDPTPHVRTALDLIGIDQLDGIVIEP